MASRGLVLLLVALVFVVPFVIFSGSASKTTVEGALSNVDAWDAIDVDGDGDMDLCAGDEYGRAYFYENDADGTFTKNTIRSSTIAAGFSGATKNEGATWVDVNNDGNQECVIVDQRNGRVFLYAPDIAGSYTGTWSYGVIQNSLATTTGKVGYLQSAENWDIDFDGQEDILLVYEGFYSQTDQDNHAGLAWLTYNSGSLTASTSYTFNKISPIQTAWWITPERRDLDGDGNVDDFVFSGRNSSSFIQQGVFAAYAPDTPTSTWTFETLTPDDQDWLHVDFGNFFGTDKAGRRDVLATNYNGDLYIFEYANDWASTSITTSNADEVRFNAATYAFATNSRDRIVSAGGSDGFTQNGDFVIWGWNGSSWVKEVDIANELQKPDDRMIVFDVDVSGTLDEVFISDSGLNDLYYYSISGLEFEELVINKIPFISNTIFSNVIIGTK